MNCVADTMWGCEIPRSFKQNNPFSCKMTNSHICNVMTEGSMQRKQFSSDQNQQQLVWKAVSGKAQGFSTAAWGRLEMGGLYKGGCVRAAGEHLA